MLPPGLFTVALSRVVARGIVVGLLLLVAWMAVGNDVVVRAEERPPGPVASESAGPAFGESIAPLLAAKCVHCHGESLREAELDLSSWSSLMRGGSSGPSVTAGNAAQSLLFQLVRDRKMPPDGEPELREDEIAKIQRWIQAGAIGPAETEAASGWATRMQEGARFWSFQPIVRPPVPDLDASTNEEVSTADNRLSPGLASREHPIDAFLRESLARHALPQAPRADRRTLARRAYLDLVGLPPTPERVEAFVHDTTPDVWPRLIEELLNMPQYGERWGRHWLDVARYADTGGYETDIYYKNAWRYRDYVIKSFNDNKPYDRFVQEQIAGDELWPDNLDLAGSYVMPVEKLQHFEALTGTGFYALGPQIHESNMDARKLAQERLTDWVDTTGAAFLGLTLGCARCHDHKFDPISQRDYYALQALFSGSKEVDVPIVHAMGIADFRQHYPMLLAVDEARQAYRLFENRTRGRAVTDAEQDERTRLLEAIARAVLAVPPSDAQGVRFDGLMEIPTVTVLGHEREPLVPAVRWLARGDLDRPRDEVAPAVPAVFTGNASPADQSFRPALPPSTAPNRRRAELALWLTRPDHPLTSRVMVNRIWQWHFGRGLVSTPSDFGQMGQRPSHPQLLDWLAAEFIASGWNIKDLHRRIMTSEAYQQASDYGTPRHAEVDPDNRLLWRMNRRRLEGETLWDAIHSVAGTLNPKMGGRPVLPPLVAEELTNKSQWVVSADPAEHTRRGIYILVRRNFRFPLFDLFDAPVNAVSCAGREESTVAPQALWLLNNQTAHDQADAFAARILKEAGPDTTARIQRAWHLALGRPASPQEVLEATRMIAQLSAAGTPADGVAEVDTVADGVTDGDRRAWSLFALSLFNLNEFVMVD